MGKRKGSKKASTSPKIPQDVQVSGSIAAGSSPSSDSAKDAQNSKEALASLHMASVNEIQDPISKLASGSEKQITVAIVKSAKVIPVANPKKSQEVGDLEEGEISPNNSNKPEPVTVKGDKQDPWTHLFKGTTKKLQKRGESFLLPSGESIIGKFYSDPPSQGTIQTIVNGIWSKQFRDITVSKMEGFAFLLRIPNASTRAYVLKKFLWHIEGQTMFVAKWEPSIVGDPKFLHPQTANKTNLEIRRIRVSSPWMPPVCSFCKEIGHSLKRCKKAPITCKICKSSGHFQADCTRAKRKTGAKPASNHGPLNVTSDPRLTPPANLRGSTNTSPTKSEASFSNLEKGGTSNPEGLRVTIPKGDRPPDSGNSETSAAESDSSDIDSPTSPLNDDSGFQEVFSSRQKKKDRGRGPKLK
ncbi:hypothetical protein Bca101_060003 [Brassica carinata]